MENKRKLGICSLFRGKRTTLGLSSTDTFIPQLALYKKQLKPLQGRCVPNIIGAYAAPGVVNVVMEPPHSSFWIEASTDMPFSLKQRCVDAFAAIHSRGVFHGDVELRHMLVGGDARVSIIDFQESSALKPNEEVFLRPATDADLRKEMRKVKVKLDYPGARAYEKEKRERCSSLHKRNADESRKVILNPSYTPLLEEEAEEDILNPPVLDAQEWQDWIAAPNSPRLFVVPGQSLHQRAGAYEAFIVSLKPVSPVPPDTPSGPSFYMPPSSPPQAEIRQRLMQTDFQNSFPQPPAGLGASLRSRTISSIASPLKVERREEILNNSPQGPAGLTDPSTTGALNRLALLRALVELPSQASDDPLPSQATRLFGSELARIRRNGLVRKRSMSPDDENHPSKRICLDVGVSESGASFAAVEASRDSDSIPTAVTQPPENCSSRSSPDNKPQVLGKFKWLPNLRYPALPTPKTEDDRKTWAQIAMGSLGQCALQELPHPDLISLYPDHPRWVDPDVRVFLGRLQRKEEQSASLALLHPDKTYHVPRHPRAAGTLKRTLSEIQHDLEYSTVEELIIRGQNRSGREVDEHDPETTRAPTDIDNLQQNCLSTDVSSPARVRFVDPSEDKGISSLVTETQTASEAMIISHTTEIPTQSHCTLDNPWYRKPFGFVTHVLDWV